MIAALVSAVIIFCIVLGLSDLVGKILGKLFNLIPAPKVKEVPPQPTNWDFEEWQYLHKGQTPPWWKEPLISSRESQHPSQP